MKKRKPPRLGLLSLGQFDPYGRDGASLDIKEKLRFLRSREFAITIFNFLFSDQPRFFLKRPGIGPKSNDRKLEGSLDRTRHFGLPYVQDILPCRFSEWPFRYRDITKRILDTLPEFKLDYLLTIDQGFIPLLAGRLSGIPTGHMFFSLSNVLGFPNRSEDVLLLKGASIFANSQYLKAAVENRFGLEAVTWLPCIDFDGCRVEGKRGKLLGFCAKSQAESDQTILEIARRLPERRIVVVGEDDFISGKKPANITCWGQVKDRRKIFRQIGLLLVPSREEAFSMVVLEAASNGIPSVANRVGGIPEAMGGSGVLIDIIPGEEDRWDIAKTADKYVETIERFMTDGDFYSRHSRKALARSDEYRKIQERMSDDIVRSRILPSIEVKHN